MTENLAGRGEGLAGLVAKWREIGKKYLGPPLKLKSRDETMVMAGIETAAQAVYVICADQLQAEIAALEAAAPPSTAAGLRELIEELTPMVDFYLKREIESPSNHQEFAREASVKLDKWYELASIVPASPNAVLATLSPKAPAVGDIESLAATFHAIYQCEARRQGDVRHKDAYADLPENIKEFDRVLARYVLLNFEVARIASAATQEQPAGSPQVVTDLQVALRIVGDWREDSRGLVHVHKDAIRKAIVAALRSAGNPGSPRKVGEDGARMHPDRKTPITHEQAREAVAHFVNTHFRNPGQKSRASIPAHQDDDDMLLNDYITQQERLSVRSSSVPVGEQKQEEGV